MHETGGSRMSITVNQIAEKCGVSRTTVLRALNNQGSVGKNTREKILNEPIDPFFIGIRGCNN